MNRQMNRIFTIATLLVSLVFQLGNPAFSQKGSSFLKHYTLPSDISNQNWAYEQDSDGIMLVLNRKGIYEFDGNHWYNINVPGRPIAFKYKELLFYCTDHGVGYMIGSRKRQYVHHQLISTEGKELFFKLVDCNEGLLAISPQSICRIKVGPNPTFDTLYNDNRAQVFISDAFTMDGKLYHVKNRALIYRTHSNEKHQLLAGLPRSEDFLFSFQHESTVFFGTTLGRVLKFDGNNLEQFAFDQSQYVASSSLTGGVSIGTNRVAFFTLNGGCIVVDTDKGTSEIINFTTGLPDDEVYALGTDRDGGLWISHAMGISRADLELPIENMSYFPQLAGNVYAAVEFNGELLAATSEGLFKLVETREYKTVRTEMADSKKEQKAETVQQHQHTDEQVQTKKQIFLKRLFARKTDTEQVDEASSRGGGVSGSDSERSTKTALRKGKLYDLQAVRYSYKKIDGPFEKVRTLNVLGNRLIVGSSSGLFQWDGSSVSNIAKGMNVQFVECSSDNNLLMVAADQGAYIFRKGNGAWSRQNLMETENESVTSIAAINENEYVVVTEFEVHLVDIQTGKRQKINTFEFKGGAMPSASRAGDDLLVFVNNVLLKYDGNTKTLVPYNPFQGEAIAKVIKLQEGFTWIKTRLGWQLADSKAENSLSNINLLGLFPQPNGIFIGPNGHIIVVDKYSDIYRIGNATSPLSNKALSIYLRQVNGSLGEVIDPANINLTYSKSALKICIGAPLYVAEEGVKYQYRILGLYDAWSEWTENSIIEFPFFPPGSYTIYIRARDILGRLSEPMAIPFVVSPPFWKTLPFFVAIAIVLTFLVIVVIRARERKLKQERDLLEQRVKERTQTIEQQKEVLREQRDYIFRQNDEITKSILYAKRIQTAVMPSDQFIQQMLAKHFIFFRPRDIVSGDFYWMSQRDSKTYIVAADCTGHGVPGAFMSMMGVSFLNDIVNVTGIEEPHEILNLLRTKIKNTLQQTGKEGETRDGMDIAICTIDWARKRLLYSGAYNPLYFFRKGKLIEYKADKMPVGVHINEKESFSTHEIEIEKGDRFYIFSDGYVSQFGGENGKKLMARPFKELLSQIQAEPLENHAKILEEYLDAWQGPYDQIDDILIIGVEIP